MKPEIKSIHSPDVDDLENPSFEGPDDVHLLLEMTIGPKSGRGEEIFSLVVGTFEGLQSRHEGKMPRLLRHHLVVETYDYDEIFDLIKKTCDRVREETWTEVAEKLNRYFAWEFEDYDPG